MSWRKAISNIRENITGTPTSNSWRKDLLDIAEKQGNITNSWREALILWAMQKGIYTNSWRDALIKLSFAMGSENPLSWRNSIIFIADNLIEAPEIELPNLPNGFFFLKARNGLVTNASNFIVVRG